MSTFVREETHSQPKSERTQRGGDGQDSSHGRLWKLCLLAIASLSVLVLGTAFVWVSMGSQKSAPALTHAIMRGTLMVTVTEQGTLESSRNTEIKCEIRGGYGGRGGRSTVIWVIQPGTVVQAGDELVRLDTQRIEETVSLGKTDLNNEIAKLAQAQADLEKAQVALDGYLEGRFRAKMQSLENQLAEDARNLLTAQTMFHSSESLFEKGYVTQLEVDAMGYTVQRAELERDVTKNEIDVQARLVRAMELETLNGQLTATKARVAGREAGVALEQGRLDLALVELENCVIKAPRSGLVIFPSTAKWKEVPDIDVGASVYNNQVLLLMPDLSRMQVKIGIHESIIDDIQAGQTARIRMPDRTLDTSISSVATIASPAGWWTGNAVEYETTLQLPPVEGLKPGMTVDVDVVVAKFEDVLSVPAIAVVDTDEGHFCWVRTDEEVQRRALELGPSNDEFIVVEAGLNTGETVVLDPTVSIEEARRLVGPTLVHTISRGNLPVTLTEQGTLESSDNVKIKCKVRGNSTIIWVIESGTKVKAGDELIRLENKQIEEYLHERTKFAHLSRDSAITFRAQATRAGLALSVYKEGTYRTDLMTLEKGEAIAEADLLSAMNLLGHARVMAESEYVGELEIEEREFAVRNAKANLQRWKTQINALTQFTRKEEIVTRKGDWEAAKAAAYGHEEVLTMDEERIALARKEIEGCVIRAERDGIVIYPNSEEWKNVPDIADGAIVHNDQVLLLMPDLSRMQVKVGIHESMIDRIKPGMRASVTLPGKTLAGSVSSVASTAQPAGWWTGNIVKYDVIIQLPSEEGLKPGMSAKVEVIMDQHTDVLTIPVDAVVQTEAGYSCWVGTVEQAQQRDLQLGDGNDVFVVVEAGLQEGDQVVLNPAALIEEAKPMSVPSDSTTTSRRPDNPTDDSDGLRSHAQ
ncbi:MAG: HlyD family efflux transporter periplasmic adaptor subunit [Fuerstiella sp.]|nr:HlyD family efflux transporter periplasmic adaptor subunit [Fuerstiella sp.]MCP4854241.1 HlyD family efflux transporter periplasmic adaptor subunit [Fuerstiella sp.]